MERVTGGDCTEKNKVIICHLKTNVCTVTEQGKKSRFLKIFVNTAVNLVVVTAVKIVLKLVSKV